jgi:hypothetical protein
MTHVEYIGNVQNVPNTLSGPVKRTQYVDLPRVALKPDTFVLSAVKLSVNQFSKSLSKMKYSRKKNKKKTNKRNLDQPRLFASLCLETRMF